MTTSTAAPGATSPAGGARQSSLAGRASSGHLWPVTKQLAWRSGLGMIRIPATIIPTLVMPIFFTLVFGGAFGALTRLPGFPTDNILNWMVPFSVLQGSAFAGLGAAFGAGKDIENGFYDRLLLAPAPRLGLVLGPLLYSAARALLPAATVIAVGYLGGARIQGGALSLLVLLVGAMGTAIVAGLWGLGITYRLKSQRAGGLVQVGIFVTIFLSAGQVPLSSMEGWLHTAASINPFTAVLTMARQGFLGAVTWDDTWPGLAALAIGGSLLALFAHRGFRKLIP